MEMTFSEESARTQYGVMVGNMARLPKFDFTYFIGVLWDLNESIFVKYLKWSPGISYVLYLCLLNKFFLKFKVNQEKSGVPSSH